jgi:nitrate/nitrite transporter NarK
MGGIGAPELLILLVLLPVLFFAFIFPVWGIIDAAMRPDPVWDATGQNKIVWILVQFFLWTIGAFIYFIAIRPKLVAATTRPYP